MCLTWLWWPNSSVHRIPLNYGWNVRRNRKHGSLGTQAKEKAAISPRGLREFSGFLSGRSESELLLRGK